MVLGKYAEMKRSDKFRIDYIFVQQKFSIYTKIFLILFLFTNILSLFTNPYSILKT